MGLGRLVYADEPGKLAATNNVGASKPTREGGPIGIAQSLGCPEPVGTAVEQQRHEGRPRHRTGAGGSLPIGVACGEYRGGLHMHLSCLHTRAGPCDQRPRPRAVRWHPEALSAGTPAATARRARLLALAHRGPHPGHHGW